jgi:hypothetical protein
MGHHIRARRLLVATRHAAAAGRGCRALIAFGADVSATPVASLDIAVV